MKKAGIPKPIIINDKDSVNDSSVQKDITKATLSEDEDNTEDDEIDPNNDDESNIIYIKNDEIKGAFRSMGTTSLPMIWTDHTKNSNLNDDLEILHYLDNSGELLIKSSLTAIKGKFSKQKTTENNKISENIKLFNTTILKLSTKSDYVQTQVNELTTEWKSDEGIDLDNIIDIIDNRSSLKESGSLKSNKYNFVTNTKSENESEYDLYNCTLDQMIEHYSILSNALHIRKVTPEYVMLYMMTLPIVMNNNGMNFSYYDWGYDSIKINYIITRLLKNHLLSILDITEDETNANSLTKDQILDAFETCDEKFREYKYINLKTEIDKEFIDCIDQFFDTETPKCVDITLSPDKEIEGHLNYLKTKNYAIESHVQNKRAHVTVNCNIKTGDYIGTYGMEIMKNVNGKLMTLEDLYSRSVEEFALNETFLSTQDLGDIYNSIRPINIEGKILFVRTNKKFKSTSQQLLMLIRLEPNESKPSNVFSIFQKGSVYFNKEPQVQHIKTVDLKERPLISIKNANNITNVIDNSVNRIYGGYVFLGDHLNLMIKELESNFDRLNKIYDTYISYVEEISHKTRIFNYKLKVLSAAIETLAYNINEDNFIHHAKLFEYIDLYVTLICQIKAISFMLNELHKFYIDTYDFYTIYYAIIEKLIFIFEMDSDNEGIKEINEMINGIDCRKVDEYISQMNGNLPNVIKSIKWKFQNGLNWENESKVFIPSEYLKVNRNNEVAEYVVTFYHWSDYIGLKPFMPLYKNSNSLIESYDIIKKELNENDWEIFKSVFANVMVKPNGEIIALRDISKFEKLYCSQSNLFKHPIVWDIRPLLKISTRLSSELRRLICECNNGEYYCITNNEDKNGNFGIYELLTEEDSNTHEFIRKVDLYRNYDIEFLDVKQHIKVESIIKKESKDHKFTFFYVDKNKVNNKIDEVGMMALKSSLNCIMDTSLRRNRYYYPAHDKIVENYARLYGIGADRDKFIKIRNDKLNYPSQVEEAPLFIKAMPHPIYKNQLGVFIDHKYFEKPENELYNTMSYNPEITYENPVIGRYRGRLFWRDEDIIKEKLYLEAKKDDSNFCNSDFSVHFYGKEFLVSGHYDEFSNYWTCKINHGWTSPLDKIIEVDPDWKHSLEYEEFKNAFNDNRVIFKYHIPSFSNAAVSSTGVIILKQQNIVDTIGYTELLFDYGDSYWKDSNIKPDMNISNLIDYLPCDEKGSNLGFHNENVKDELIKLLKKSSPYYLGTTDPSNVINQSTYKPDLLKPLFEEEEDIYIDDKKIATVYDPDRIKTDLDLYDLGSHVSLPLHIITENSVTYALFILYQIELGIINNSTFKNDYKSKLNLIHDEKGMRSIIVNMMNEENNDTSKLFMSSASPIKQCYDIVQKAGISQLFYNEINADMILNEMRGYLENASKSLYTRGITDIEVIIIMIFYGISKSIIIRKGGEIDKNVYQFKKGIKNLIDLAAVYMHKIINTKTHPLNPKDKMEYYINDTFTHLHTFIESIRPKIIESNSKPNKDKTKKSKTLNTSQLQKRFEKFVNYMTGLEQGTYKSTKKNKKAMNPSLQKELFSKYMENEIIKELWNNHKNIDVFNEIMETNRRDAELVKLFKGI